MSNRYHLRILAINTEATTDAGVGANFTLLVYLNNLPDKSVHPGAIEYIKLPDNLFSVENPVYNVT